ncbi:MAG: DUF1841 family protein [gamma proteobacterium symbiont of Lucinoma myriamae]|nr:DUF1841 family protein [gamma proteobacterium symbiont of Lucinoma myriamae]MCU7818143.1 DUF1841 family protein [gamma proteobacterium symbiont of Lucinoma myriamae]MCU7832989.1 DUF1841 family protein [gamma proteobacterium symbiont of Lucinoma myriamae]
MLFGQDRNQLRKVYFQSWNKFKNKLPMEPMESLIASLISQHPEYHDFFDQIEQNQDKDFTPEMGQTNPFLHLGMHISIQEQLGTQRPPEITSLYQSLCTKLGDAHEAEHQMMDCLGEMLWSAQRNNEQPNENTYIECVKKLL